MMPNICPTCKRYKVPRKLQNQIKSQFELIEYFYLQGQTDALTRKEGYLKILKDKIHSLEEKAKRKSKIADFQGSSEYEDEARTFKWLLEEYLNKHTRRRDYEMP